MTRVKQLLSDIKFHKNIIKEASNEKEALQDLINLQNTQISILDDDMKHAKSAIKKIEGYLKHEEAKALTVKESK